MKYASETTVSVEKSRAEIESIVRRYGASGFASGWSMEKAVIEFELKNRRVRFILPLPSRKDFRLTPRTQKIRSEQAMEEAWEQGCRQRWRALALAIKAKLEAVDSGIAVFDEEFMAYVVTPGGATIGELVRPQIESFYESGKVPPLLPGPIAS